MVAIIAKLRDQVAQIEQSYHRPFAALYLSTGLSCIDEALKGGLRRGAVHEFLGEGYDRLLCARPTRFIAQILAQATGPVIWLMSMQTNGHGQFSPHAKCRDRVGKTSFCHGAELRSATGLKLAGLQAAGLSSERVLYLEVTPSHLISIMEDILRTKNVTAVVADITEPLSLTTSRRLHLAAEASGATGFVIHRHHRLVTSTSCWTRWRIGAARSAPVRLGSQTLLSFPGPLSVSLLRRRGGDALFWRVGTDHVASFSFPVGAALAHDALAQGKSRSRPCTSPGAVWA